jgi:hypothetical protein
MKENDLKNGFTSGISIDVTKLDLNQTISRTVNLCLVDEPPKLQGM